MNTNIYLDIDGVLLANNHIAANHADEFLRYVLREFPNSTYWLTTRCNGDAIVTVQQISKYFSDDIQRLLPMIQPTSWHTAKTRAINFNQPFLWFDDNVFTEEIRTLEEHSALDNLIKVDLKKNPNMLKQLITDFPLPVQQ